MATTPAPKLPCPPPAPSLFRADAERMVVEHASTRWTEDYTVSVLVFGGMKVLYADAVGRDHRTGLPVVHFPEDN